MASAFASISLACVFLGLLFVLHFLKPELDPAWRWISEYEIGRFGWIMRVAFCCWGASVLALTISAWSSMQLAAGILSRWWLVSIAIALFGAALFKTNAITDRTPSWENTLHTICGIIVILTLPIAATLASVSLSRSAAWSADRALLVAATALTWVGLTVFLASNVVAVRKSPSGERAGAAELRVGWQNRFMVVTYALWLVLVSAASPHL